jgi:hypothetical protein
LADDDANLAEAFGHNPETFAGRQERFDSIRTAEWFGRERDKADMQNKPTRGEVADVREAAQALFQNVPLSSAVAMDEIHAAMPDKESHAERKADAEDCPPRGPVVRDDALHGSAGHRPDDQQRSAVSEGQGAVQRDRSDGSHTSGPRHQSDVAVQARELVPVAVDYERQLEPRTLAEAFNLAKSMFQSRLFSAYGSDHAVLSTILAGREFGMPAMASLRAFHIIEGRPTLAADTIRALVLQSGAAEYFRCTERTNERATFATKRKGEPEFTLSYTVAEARIAFKGDDIAFAKSAWGKYPADMCVARAGAKLARLVYPDVVHGVYSREEFDQ